MGGATCCIGMHHNFNAGIYSEDITMIVKANDVDRLCDEIDILEKDVKKYKYIWKKAESNYEYMFRCNAEKEETIVKLELQIAFYLKYTLEQKTRHKNNHENAMKVATDAMSKDNILATANAFEEAMIEAGYPLPNPVAIEQLIKG